jgi:hypothetical protein
MPNSPGLGQPVGPPQARLRRLTDDVVIISTYVKVREQALSAADAMRDNHALHV